MSWVKRLAAAPMPAHQELGAGRHRVDDRRSFLIGDDADLQWLRGRRRPMKVVTAGPSVSNARQWCRSACPRATSRDCRVRGRAPRESARGLRYPRSRACSRCDPKQLRVCVGTELRTLGPTRLQDRPRAPLRLRTLEAWRSPARPAPHSAQRRAPVGPSPRRPDDESLLPAQQATPDRGQQHHPRSASSQLTSSSVSSPRSWAPISSWRSRRTASATVSPTVAPREAASFFSS